MSKEDLEMDAYVSEMRKEAFENGKKVGWTEGFEEGYAQGYQDGDHSVSTGQLIGDDNES